MGSKQGKFGQSPGGEKSAGAPKDIPSLAKYIQSGKCRKVAFMLGAGISTAAGIPDFRSPETGLYSNLARLNLPHPEAVFEIGFFRRNPVPFYTLAQELYPGKFRPTKSHSFIRLLDAHGLLHICFTQNIDTLERRAGIPDDKIVEAHGSFATQRCIECKRPYDDEDMKRCIKVQRIPRCEECNGLVKPDIVFFGESLPKNFIGSLPDLITADLLIIMGTSLTVHPFATLAGVPSETTPRVLINLDRVGDIGSMPRDLVLLGKCDEIVEELCKELGWHEELLQLWEETADTVITEESEHPEKPGTEDSDSIPPAPSGSRGGAVGVVHDLVTAMKEKLKVTEEEPLEGASAGSDADAEGSVDDTEPIQASDNAATQGSAGNTEPIQASDDATSKGSTGNVKPIQANDDTTAEGSAGDTKPVQASNDATAEGSVGNTKPVQASSGTTTEKL